MGRFFAFGREREGNTTNVKLGRLLTRVVARTDSPRNVKTAVNVNKPRAVKVTKK